jgi:hypothetical protein
MPARETMSLIALATGSSVEHRSVVTSTSDWTLLRLFQDLSNGWAIVVTVAFLVVDYFLHAR